VRPENLGGYRGQSFLKGAATNVDQTRIRMHSPGKENRGGRLWKAYGWDKEGKSQVIKENQSDQGGEKKRIQKKRHKACCNARKGEGVPSKRS